MSSIDKIILGTWQAEQISPDVFYSLVRYAKKLGITKFDTASVYAKGIAESILGECVDDRDRIVTKVPAVDKKFTKISLAYPKLMIANSIKESISRLGHVPDSILLHNWNELWEIDEDSPNIINSLRELSAAEGIRHIGISLPDGYNGDIETHNIISQIDVIEAPWNIKSPSLDIDRLTALALRKQVLVRSIFLHGQNTKNKSQKLRTVMGSGCYPIIGATAIWQITQWKGIVNG